MTQRYIDKTGNYDYCFVGILKSTEAIAAQRQAMIDHLDEVREFLKSCILNLELLILFQERLFLKLVIMIDTCLKRKFHNTSIHFKIYNSIFNNLY